MIDLPKTEKEFYESQSKEQLIIFLLNEDRKNKLLREKLGMLTGCPGFGNCDSMDGSCVDCFYEDPTLNMQCRQFQDKFTKMLKEKAKEEE